MKNRLYILFFFILIFLSLFPRSIELLNQNPVFSFDQGREYLSAKSIVVDGKLILIGTEIGAGVAGISGIFQGPVYYYMLTIPFVLFNGNPVGGIYLMFLFGILSVIISFYLGKRIFGFPGGCLFALLTACAPILIPQSRFIWSPNLSTFFILLCFYFIYSLPKKRISHVFLASFFAGFIYNFEIAVAVPLSLAVIVYSVFIFKKDFRKYLYIFLGFIFAYLPMIFFEIRHNFIGVRGLLLYLTNHKSTPAGSAISFLPDHLKSFLFNFKDSFPIDSFLLSTLFFVALIVCATYLLLKEKSKDYKYFFSFLLFLIPLNFFIFSFLKNTVWNYYLIDLNIVYILLFIYITFSFRDRKQTLFKFFCIAAIVLFIISSLISSVRTSVKDYPDYGATAKLKGKIDVIDYIYKDAKGKPFGTLVFSPPVYTYPYDYLFWWYGKNRYGYLPYQEKKGTFYLLIEPDPEKPWSYNGWLETVIKEGKIQSTVNLKSGFIVQKRIAE